MAKSPHTSGERGIVPDWRAVEITRRLEVHDPPAIKADPGPSGVGPSWVCLHPGKTWWGRGGRFAAPPHLAPMIDDPPTAGQATCEAGRAPTPPALGFA